MNTPPLREVTAVRFAIGERLLPSTLAARMIRLLQFLPGWLGLLLATVGPLRALEIQQTIWGFDGHVVPDCFNPLSVLVSNPGNGAFDGALILSPEGIGVRSAEFVQPIFLAPHTSRWVQFYVLTGNGTEGEELRWGRGDRERWPLDPVKGAPPACVWLRDTDSPFAVAGSLKSFPDQLFPTTASAAEGLDAVVLDHVPRWEPARREAFLVWVKLGGIVHLLPGADGKLPVFGAGLEALDTRENIASVGLGRVVHHTIVPQEMSEGFLADHGYHPRTIVNTQNPVLFDFDGPIFRKLGSLTKPKVSWSLVNLLVLAYVAAIGPVHNYYRRRLDYRVSILVFLGCVTVFSMALGITGRRGYGESQTVHSLAVAHALGGGQADVTQWISAFATKGDRYTLTHRAPVNLYATDRSAEAGSGLIFNGKDGRIQLDIPLYSARAFVHRAIMTGDDTSVTVEKWEESGGVIRALRLKTAPGFPALPVEIRAVHDDRSYAVVQKNGGLELSGTAPERLETEFSREKLQPLMYANGMVFGGNNNPVDSDAFNELMPLLKARALKVPGLFPNLVSTLSHHADLQLLIVAPAPPSFQLQGEGFTHEKGWVLYVQDVFKP